MKLQLRIALLAGALVISALALAATPASAKGMPEGTPPHGNGNPGSQENSPEYGPPGDVTPGPKAGLPEKAKAYGRYCKSESRKHVKGEKGTAFSRCVTAMAKAANNEKLNAKRACRGLSKKHVKGEKGTEFSRCVRDANRLRKQQHREEKEQAREEEEATEGS